MSRSVRIRLASGLKQSTATRDVKGTITLLVSTYGTYKEDDNCNYSAEYSLRLYKGTAIVVRDGSNNIIGIGRLGEGKLKAEKSSDNGRQYCLIPFTISDVPTTSFYVFSIPSVTGESYFTKDELEALKWTVAISI